MPDGEEVWEQQEVERQIGKNRTEESRGEAASKARQDIFLSLALKQVSGL